VERDLLVFLDELWPVLQKSCCAETHEVHVT
jgi:hypothetical protein